MTNCRHPASAGFTLIELMTVIAIIAILAGIVIGVAGYATAKADRGRAIADMEKIKNVLEEYRVENGGYFTNAVDTPMSGASFTALYRYKKDLNLTNDPWGNPYYYKRTAQFQYVLWSLGPDKISPADDVDSAQSGQ